MADTAQLPAKFLERLSLIVPEAKLDNVLASFSSKKPRSIRVNRLKTDTETMAATLRNEGYILEPVPWYVDAYSIIKEPENRSLTELPPYQDGLFYIQSLPSMIPPLVLDPQPDEIILDIAAAPGSKTTQMASMMQNTGQIVANDISTERLYKLKANLLQQGVTNTKITKLPGQVLWKKFPEYFDKTLVDAPCSLEGRISLLQPKTYAGWSPKKVEILSQRERYLLRSAVSATKVGGTIVYSTCTLSPEENEFVIDWILKKEQGKVVLEEIHIPELTSDKPIETWKKDSFDRSIQNTLRIFPSNEMEGFFVAKLRKIASSFSL